MKFKLSTILFLCLGIIIQQAHAEKKEKTAPLKDYKDKLSYIIGRNMGSDFKKQSIDIKPEVLLAGIKDGMSGGQSLLSETETHEIMETFRNERTAGVQGPDAMNASLAEKNRKEGEAFLAKNKKKDGVKTLPSGLQYKVIKTGEGPTPKISDMVETHYVGALIDGTEFDNSFKRGSPAEFPVNGVIAGWTEALQRMKVGAKWRLFIPSDLAYGQRGSGPIGPNATLIFEIELIAIK